MKLIKILQEADATLEIDGYKSWSYVRIAISEAIKHISENRERLINQGMIKPINTDIDKPKE